MKQLPALMISLDAVKSDPALRSGARGARKILVTQLYPDCEKLVDGTVWGPPAGGSKCPVQVTVDTEIAVFTCHARQERHYHECATEIYEVLEGVMVIEVEGQDYTLAAGDIIVVRAGAAHEVKPQGTPFLCRVLTANCGGTADKYPAPVSRKP